MTTLSDLLALASSHPESIIALRLPDGRTVPPHFHITEVAHVMKRFVDCGGSMHHHESCQLQAWVAEDLEHRVSAGKLAGILAHFEKLSDDADLPLEVEYEDVAISQYPVASVALEDGQIVLGLETRHTDCLAKEACGLEPAGESCCEGSGCC